MKIPPTISIIIPLYNCEHYIAACLDSLLCQTIGTDVLEIIVIDDCSSDQSRSIAHTYTQNHPTCITLLIHAENKGPGGARNTGLACATGDYISFVDADDMLEPTALEASNNKLTEHGADLIIFPFTFISPSQKTYSLGPMEKLWQKECVITHENVSQYPELVFSLHACNKIYSKDLIKKLPAFPAHQILNEDARFAFCAITHAQKIVITDIPHYIYRRRENATSATEQRFATVESFANHLTHHCYLKEFATATPEFLYMTQWYHVYKWGVFIRKILLKQTVLSTTRQKHFYQETKKLFTDIPDDFLCPGPRMQNALLLTTLHHTTSLHAAQKYYKKRYRALRVYYWLKDVLLFWRS